MRGAKPRGTSIKRLRQLSGWTQEVLAQHAGCDVKTIRNAERSRRVDTTTLAQIAAALDVRVAELLQNDQEAAPHDALHLELVRRWQDAWNRRNVKDVLAVYHDQAVLDCPAIQPHETKGAHGKRALKDRIESSFARFQEDRAPTEKLLLHAIDGTVLLRSIRSGFVIGTGRRFQSRCLHEFHFLEGLIFRHISIFDTAPFALALQDPQRDPQADSQADSQGEQ